MKQNLSNKDISAEFVQRLCAYSMSRLPEMLDTYALAQFGKSIYGIYAMLLTKVLAMIFHVFLKLFASMVKLDFGGPRDYCN